MVRAVLMHKPDSIYDDKPEERYNFPRQYLSRMKETVGDWIVFYEPGSAHGGKGRKEYFAVAQVDGIRPDPARQGWFFADMRPGTFLRFDRWVPRVLGGRVVESSIRKDNGDLMSGGVAQSAVRSITNLEFEKIAGYGLPSDLSELGLDQAVETVDGFHDPAIPFDRPIVERLMNRPYRDARFRIQVKRAYENTCAFSGLKLRNGGGRPEVEAAHIIPVENGGSDDVRNGLALSHTLHWMFDRGMISVGENHEILVSHNKVPRETADRLFRPDRKIIVPEDPAFRPHPEYLRWHRENKFGLAA